MKTALLVAALFFAKAAAASVLEVKDATAESVIDAYEQMQEQEVAGEDDQRWIHEFETESLGSEMDHLSVLKSTAEWEEGM